MSEEGDQSSGSDTDSEANLRASANAAVLGAITTLITSLAFVAEADPIYGFILRPSTPEDGQHFALLMPIWGHHTSQESAEAEDEDADANDLYD